MAPVISTVAQLAEVSETSALAGNDIVAAGRGVSALDEMAAAAAVAAIDGTSVPPPPGGGMGDRGAVAAGGGGGLEKQVSIGSGAVPPAGVIPPYTLLIVLTAGPPSDIKVRDPVL